MLENQEENQKPINNELEARQNIAGFFSLLLEIDKRLNPQFYQAPNKELNNKKYDNHNGSPDNTN